MTHTEHFIEKKPTSSTSSSTSSSTITTTTTSSSTTTGIHTTPGVRITADQWEELRTIYEGCGLGVLSMPVSYMIQDFNEHYDMSYDVIRAAIMETGFAPRPSAYYLRAVLDRAAGDDIHTLDEWNAAKKEYAYHVRKKWYRPAWELER